MPAPYPPRTPGRAMQSKLNRGAPRGGGQARGLSGVRGDQFPSVARPGSDWVYDVDNVWEGVNDLDISFLAGGSELVTFSQTVAAPFVTVSGGSPEAAEDGLYQILVDGVMTIDDLASAYVIYNTGTSGSIVESPPQASGGTREFRQTLTVALFGAGFGALEPFVGSWDGDIDILAGDIYCQIWQVIRGG